MASNGVKQQPLVPLKRRRNNGSSSKTAPLAANNVPHEDLTLPTSESIMGKIQPNFQQLGIAIGTYLSVGTICFFLVRHQIKGKKTNGLLDSLYLSMTTMTTVGYGDLVPDSFPAKIFSSVLAFAGMVLVGLILKKAANYLIEKQELMMVKALSTCQKLGLIESLKSIDDDDEGIQSSSRVKYKCVITLVVISVHMVLGMIFLSWVEELDTDDCFYCVCSTITTLGFGDKSFQTPFGRFFAIFWILTSTTSLGHFFFNIVELYTEHKQKALVKLVLTWRMTNIDLEADADDGAVGAAEFVVCKLKEMGKINQEDVSLVMEEFEDLDVHQMGKLGASNGMLAQSFEAGR